MREETRVSQDVARHAVWIRRAEPWLLALVVLAAVVLRLSAPKMGADLWYDEAYSCHVASRPFGEMMRLLYLGGDTNPPLYTLVLHFWLMLARSDFFVKLLSLVFGIGTLVVLHRLGRRLAGPVAGLVAALLFAFSEWGVYYSLEARPYSMLFFFSLLSTYFYIRILRRIGFGRSSRRCGRWLRPAYAAATVAAMYAHWFGWLLPATHAAGLWIYRRRRGAWMGFIRWMVPVGVAVSPLLLFLWNEFEIQNAVGGFSWPGAPDLPYTLEYLQHVVGGSSLLVMTAALLLVVKIHRRPRRSKSGVLLAMPVRRRVMSTRRNVFFLAAYVLLPVAIVYAASSVREDFSFFVFRYFLAYGLGAFLLIGIALARLPRGLAVAAAVVLVGAPVYKRIREPEEQAKPYSRIARDTWPGEGRTALRLHLSPMSYYSVVRYRRPNSLVKDRILWDSEHGMSYVLDYNVRGEMIHPDHLVDFREGLRDFDEFWVVLDEIYPSRRAVALWDTLQQARSLERVSEAQYGTVRVSRYRRLAGRMPGRL
jgi:hypothetical protein